MNTLFTQVLNMSITGSYCIIVVFFIRLLLKKKPKIFSYVLWSVVLFRLVCPISFESMFSILHTEPLNLSNPTPYKITDNVSTINDNSNVTLQTSQKSPKVTKVQPTPNLPEHTKVMINIQNILPIIWLAGVCGMFLYTIVSAIRLKKSLKNAKKEDGYYIVKHLGTPFVFGLFHPRIYLMEGLKNEEISYILEHERTHIRRKDYLIKPLAFTVLSIHWFNPLVWLAFLYMGKDMEMSCDEAVIRKMGNKIKKDYSTSLLSIADKSMLFKGTPLTFGEGSVKERIKNVLSYKKSGLVGIITATAVVVCIGFTLISNPISNHENIQETKKNNTHKNQLKEMKFLEEGKKYQYDMDGDGTRDTIYWTRSDENDSVYTLSVYVNEQSIYSNEAADFEVYGKVILCNIDQKDNYMELLIDSENPDPSIEKNCTFLRYNNGMVSTLFDYATEDNKNRYSVDDLLGEWVIKGDGTIIFRNNLAVYTNTTGAMQAQVPLKLENEKLVYASADVYNLDHPLASSLGQYNYKAGNEIKVYKEADEQSETSFTIKPGQRFYADKIHVVKWNNNEKNPSKGTSFFLQIKTRDGKTGWVYIPSDTDQSQDFTGGGSVDLPVWR